MVVFYRSIPKQFQLFYTLLLHSNFANLISKWTFFPRYFNIKGGTLGILVDFRLFLIERLFYKPMSMFKKVFI